MGSNKNDFSLSVFVVQVFCLDTQIWIELISNLCKTAYAKK